MAIHTCRATVLCCMDFRLHEALAAFLKAQGLDEDRADVIRVAGAAKTLVRPADPRDREFLLEQIRSSRDLHWAKQIYLVNHEDCGVYGPEDIPDDEEEIAIHRADLAAAEQLLLEQLPGVEVVRCFIWLDGRTEVLD